MSASPTRLALPVQTTQARIKPSTSRNAGALPMLGRRRRRHRLALAKDETDDPGQERQDHRWNLQPENLHASPRFSWSSSSAWLDGLAADDPK